MKRPRGILKRNADALLLVSQVVNPLLVGLMGYLSFYFYIAKAIDKEALALCHFI